MRKPTAILAAILVMINCFPAFAADAAPVKAVEKSIEKSEGAGAYIDGRKTGCEDGKRDAGADNVWIAWCAGGMLIAGVFMGNFGETTVPAERLMGKPADYAQEYSKCYIDESQEIKKSASITGCLVTGVSVGTVLAVMAITAAMQEAVQNAGDACIEGMIQSCINGWLILF